MYVEFLEDLYEKDPKLARKAISELEGEYIVLTGDPVIDSRERAVARGEEPDMTLGDTKESLRRLREVHEQVKNQVTDVKVLGSSSPPLNTASDADLFPDMGPGQDNKAINLFREAAKGA